MSSPFARADAPKEIAEVNVVPLADVSLVLLIILLVLSPMIRQSMLHVRTAGESSKPEIAATPEELLTPKAPELVLVAAVNPDGYALGQRRFATAVEFVAALRGELAGRTDKKVFLSPHPEVPVGAVVDALETIKTSGAESVALVQTQEAAPADGQVRPAAPAP